MLFRYAPLCMYGAGPTVVFRTVGTLNAYPCEILVHRREAGQSVDPGMSPRAPARR